MLQNFSGETANYDVWLDLLTIMQRTEVQRSLLF